MADELLTAFVEDSREHLESIESDILSLETMAGDFDEELVNRIFRTAHSIKGAAGFLGLAAIESLAHKLENALHLMRDGQLSNDGQVCQVLLQGFDMLSSMINAPGQGEDKDISAILEDIKALMPLESQVSAETTLTLSATDGHEIFDVDGLSLEQALKGGKYLYHIEFDLIHDIHRQNKTPYDVIKILRDSGLILDCRVDAGAVGNLEMGIGNMIPMNVLYASIIDPDIIGILLNLPEEKIRELDKTMFRKQEDGLGLANEAYGANGRADGAVRQAQGAVLIEVPERAEASQARSLHQLLLQALQQSPHIRLDMSRTTDIDASFIQLAAAARRSCLRKNGSFGFVNPPREPVTKSMQELGLTRLLGSIA